MGRGPSCSEGLLGEAYESHIPDWFQADYYNYYLTLDQIKSSLQTLDWPAFNASAKVFQDYYAAGSSASSRWRLSRSRPPRPSRRSRHSFGSESAARV